MLRTRTDVTSVSTERTDERLVVDLWVFLDVSAEVMAVQQRLVAVLTREVFPVPSSHYGTQRISTRIYVVQVDKSLNIILCCRKVGRIT